MVKYVYVLLYINNNNDVEQSNISKILFFVTDFHGCKQTWCDSVADKDCNRRKFKRFNS